MGMERQGLAESAAKNMDDMFYSDRTGATHWYFGVEMEMFWQVFRPRKDIMVVAKTRIVPNDKEAGRTKTEDAVEVIDLETGKTVYYFPVSEMKMLGKKRTLGSVCDDLEQIATYLDPELFNRFKTQLIRTVTARQ